MRPWILVLLLAALVLTGTAWLRGAEYDEQYTLFLTAGTPRPAWPDGVLRAGDIVAMQAARFDPVAIARDLRATDVHPPLYFWLAAAWRTLLGDGLFTARLLSVVLSLGGLAAVAAIARAAAVPVVPAMLLTLGCYGFAYTGAIARGFALAQCLLLVGVAAGLHRRGGLLSGLLLGAATASNYLAVFPALVFALRRRWAVLGFLLVLPLDAWFFLAQRSSRDGQFPPFEWTDALLRLARSSGAAVFGGLPVYVSSGLRLPVTVALGVLGGLAAVAVARRWQRVGPVRWWLLAGVMATPLGLLALGLAFHTTPIELRYLAFVAPFVGLLLAGALPGWSIATLLAVQAVSLAGLMLAPQTMQPARATARAIAALHDGGTLALLPFGNDGVGIPGAFALEAAPDLPILLVRPTDTAATLGPRLGGYRRIVLVPMEQDAASRATISRLRETLDQP